MSLKVTISNLISESSHDIREISRIVQDTFDQDDTISIKIDQNETVEASDTDLLVCFAKKFCQNEVNGRRLFISENIVKMIDIIEVCFTEYFFCKNTTRSVAKEKYFLITKNLFREINSLVTVLVHT